MPQTLEEFLVREPNDGYNGARSSRGRPCGTVPARYEWNDGEVIKFVGLKIRYLYIFAKLNQVFFEHDFDKLGMLITKPEVMLSPIQMRKSDIAYFSRKQTLLDRNREDVIPAFVIEVISKGDKINQLEKKITEYFKAGAGGVPPKVIGNIIPEREVVYVYTSRRDVKICLETDICSANPVLEDFEISVNELFALPTE